jgi:hypothetical protein
MNSSSVTSSTKVRRNKTAKWLCGGILGAGLIPTMIFAAIITTIWFILFWYFETAFSSLFPVSPWYWLFLFQISLQSGMFSLYVKNWRDQHRGELFARFAAISSQAQINTYIQYHRTKKQQLSDIIRGFTSQQKGFFMESILLEKQRILLLRTLALCSTWLFCLSVPFLFWGYYLWFGYFGCLLVQWPLLGLTHGATRRINYFASHTSPHKWYLTIDYEKIKDRI